MQRFPTTTPLTAAVTDAQVRAFRRGWIESERGSATASQRLRNTVFAAICTGIIIAVCLFVAARLAFDPNTAASAGGTARARTIALGLVVLLAIAVALAALLLIRCERRVWLHRLRLDAFARANGFDLVFESGRPDYPGTLFQGGEKPVARDRLRALTGRELEFGRYEYVSRFRASVSKREWGYVALRMDRPSPQIVLEARAHRGKLSTTGVPAAYRALPATQLGDPAAEPFTLYCPREHEPEARSILNADLIALLGSGDEAIDVELVDDWLFLYTPTDWDLTDPALLHRLFRIVDTLIAPG